MALSNFLEVALFSAGEEATYAGYERVKYPMGVDGWVAYRNAPRFVYNKNEIFFPYCTDTTPCSIDQIKLFHEGVDIFAASFGTDFLLFCGVQPFFEEKGLCVSIEGDVVYLINPEIIEGKTPIRISDKDGTKIMQIMADFIEAYYPDYKPQSVAEAFILLEFLKKYVKKFRKGLAEIINNHEDGE